MNNDIGHMVDIFRYRKDVKVIVITGGPCGGKSTFMKMAKAHLEKQGFFVVIIPEAARQLIAAGFHPVKTPWKQDTGFQELVLKTILETEFHYFDVLNEMNIDQPVVFLCDRGTVDGIAYIGKASFENNILDKFSLTYSDLRDRYSGVIGLVSAADGAPEFYKMDDEREEDLEEAALLDKRTMGAWRLHQHFSVIDNSTDFPAKINRALAAHNRIVGMPITTEIEKKYVVRNFSQTQLPLGTECFEIVQVYLNRQEDRPGMECRIRIKRSYDDNSSSYYYTEKTPTEVEGVRGEYEEQITVQQFEELRSTYEDSACDYVNKIRYKFQYGSFIIELDVYLRNLKGLVILEVELPDAEALKNFVPPPGFDLVDVTSDARYSNRMLAQHGIPK